MSSQNTENSHSFQNSEDASYYDGIKGHVETEADYANTYNASPHQYPSNPSSNNKYQSKLNGRASAKNTPDMYRKSSQQTLNQRSTPKTRLSHELSYVDPDYTDPDNFFENFDKLFRVRDRSGDDLNPPSVEPSNVRNIRRILLEDFSLTPSRPFSCEPINLVQERFSAKTMTRKEKPLPHLDNVSYRPSHNNSTEYPGMTVKTQDNQTAPKDILTKEALGDTAKFGFYPKLEKDTKLPDLKIPKIQTSKPSSFNKLPTNGTEKIVEKINKFHENYLQKNKPRTSITSKTPVNIEPVSLRAKNSHQALQDMLKSKKAELNGRQSTLLSEENKAPERRTNHNDEIRVRMNSVQSIDKSITKRVLPNNDLSLDLGNNGNCSKVKFILKNLEQRTAGYYQGVAKKLQNPLNDKNPNVTSRSHYAKENISMLSNSFREKGIESLKLKEVKKMPTLAVKSTEGVGTTKNSQTQNIRTKVGDISQIYKGVRPGVKVKGHLKPMKNIRVVTTIGMPLKEIYEQNIETRSTSVPRR